MATAAVIGDGGWGTALALVLHGNRHRVSVWGPFADYVEGVNASRENAAFLPGVPLPAEVAFTADRAAAVAGAEMVVFASPSKYMREVLGSFRGLIPAEALLVSVAKGLDQRSGHRMSELAEEVLGRGPVAALSGPSHAEEVARRVPSAVTIACADHDRAVALQGLFNHGNFRVYTTDDVVGVEIGGAMKNVMALAAGISDGIGYGDNTKAALVTRGLAEMARLGLALGAHPETFAGLSGIGDLIVTCTSPLSRNRAVGLRLGRGESLQQITSSMAQVAEGVWTCATARRLADTLGVEAPITGEVCAVVHEGREPRAAVQRLLSRDPKPERDGLAAGNGPA